MNGCGRLVCAAVTVTIILGSFAVGTSRAYLKDDKACENSFTYGTADVLLEEKVWESLSDDERIIFSGRVIPKDPVVKNTGSIDLRVFLEVQVPVENVRLVSDDGKTLFAETKQELFSYEINDGWELYESYEKENCCVYIYKYEDGVLKPMEQTRPLFNSVKVINMCESEDLQGSQINIPIRAYGEQEVT